MARVTVSVSDSMLHNVDEEAHKAGITRSEYVTRAIESYITGHLAADSELHNTRLELNKCQTEVMQLNRRISKLENQLLEKDRIIESRSEEIMQLESRVNQLYSDVMKAREELARYEAALKAKEDEVAFLRSHVAQLTQSISQLSLKPGDEEIKKRRWWRFWG